MEIFAKDHTFSHKSNNEFISYSILGDCKKKLFPDLQSLQTSQEHFDIQKSFNPVIESNNKKIPSQIIEEHQAQKETSSNQGDNNLENDQDNSNQKQIEEEETKIQEQEPEAKQQQVQSSESIYQISKHIWRPYIFDFSQNSRTFYTTNTN